LLAVETPVLSIDAARCAESEGNLCSLICDSSHNITEFSHCCE